MLKFRKTLCLLRNNTKPLVKWFLVVAYISYDNIRKKGPFGSCSNYSTGYGSPRWQV